MQQFGEKIFNLGCEDISPEQAKKFQDNVRGLMFKVLQLLAEEAPDDHTLVSAMLSILLSLAANVKPLRKQLANGLRKAAYVIDEMM